MPTTDQKRPLPEPGDFLRIAINIVDALITVHDSGSICIGLTPAHIFTDHVTGTIQIRSDRPGINGVEPEYISASPYSAPELNRLNEHRPDLRSDLYSLGVILYELLTGVPPFNSPDQRELIHAHVAQQAPSPHNNNPAIPMQLSNLIMKLIRKKPEERYQSAHALRYDFEQCLKHLDESMEIPAFTLASRDTAIRFCVTERLYGREKELSLLDTALNRALEGKPSLLLLSGYSGIGKSSLVRAFQQRSCRGSILFASGKFERFSRNTPFGALVAAIGYLTRRILAAPEREMDIWRDELQRGLGENGRLITSLIPDMETLLKPQPELQDLQMPEAENRLFVTIQNMITVFAVRKHPLVLFLDDLQWVDAATLTLLSLLACSPVGCFLLVIGAYRDNEVDPRHLLAQQIAEMRLNGARLDCITLEPLGEYWVRQMVADGFSRSIEESHELASCLMEKTDGNPFFVIQLLTSLHEEGILFRNPANGSWEWDLPRLSEAPSSDNVLELMTARIKVLTGNSRETIIHAACLGSSFTAELLAELQNVSPDEVSLTLAKAVARGLLLKTANGYRFLHDRIHQAAYSLMSPDELKRCHLVCGRLLLVQSGSSWDKHPFEIANHLNMAHDLLILPDERLKLCRINLAAGKKAKAAASYHEALTYLKAGISLLSDDSWSTDYDVTFALFLTFAKCSYMLSEFDTAHSYFTRVLGTVRTGLEKALIYGDMVVMYEKMEQPERAMAAGISGLQCLGIRIGRLPVKLEMLQALFCVRWQMRGRSPNELLLLPVATDQEKIAAMKILTSLIVPSYFIGKDHAALVVLTLVTLSLTHGVTEYSSRGGRSTSLPDISITGVKEGGRVSLCCMMPTNWRWSRGTLITRPTARPQWQPLPSPPCSICVTHTALPKNTRESARLLKSTTRLKYIRLSGSS